MSLLNIEEAQGLEMAEGMYDGESAEGAEELAGIEETELAAVEAGAYDNEPSLEGIKVKARANVRARSRGKSSPRGQKKVADRVSAIAIQRNVSVNRIVPLDEVGVTAGASATFSYEAPDISRMLGVVAEISVRNAFKIKVWRFGTTDLVEPAGLTPQTSQAASMSVCDPQSALALRMQVGYGKMIGKNAAHLDFEFVNSSGTTADFTASLLLFVPKQARAFG